VNPAWKDFEVKVPGKWILTGEHSVIRGAPSIAMPHPNFGLTLNFSPNDSEFQIAPEEGIPVVHQLFKQAGIPAPATGTLHFDSTIPIGAGLGSSAALCVALTQWIAPQINLPRERWLSFATELENFFHGQSSGVDVAVALAQKPLHFVRGRELTPMNLKSLPRFSFYDTGLRAKTSECVQQVEAYLATHPEDGPKSDARMAEASLTALAGLNALNENTAENGRKAALQQLAKAMNLAHHCFMEWGLVPESVVELRERVLAEGALAAKLTGAGKGGMLVALWKD